jgi:hypothetical protein
MAEGVPHYEKDGTLHKGEYHKMPDGSLHSGKEHSDSSVPLFHLDELSGEAKEKAMKSMKKKGKKDYDLKKMRKDAAKKAMGKKKKGGDAY